MDKKLLDHLKTITDEERVILDGQTTINPALYNLDHSMTIDNKKLLEHGKLIQIRPHTRFVHFPKHNHNYVEVIYMCSGHTTHVINGVEIDLEAGDLLFLNQNATQEIYPADYEDVAVNFIILPEFFDTPLMMLGSEENMLRTFLIECLKNGNQNISYLHFKVADILPIQNLVENLIWTLQYGLPNKRSINQTTMGLLFLQLLNHIDKMELGKDHLEQELIFVVFQYIEENYRDGELSALAEKLGYDLYWMSRLIKKQTGRNYKELLQEKRLNQAAYLLNNTTLSITDISLHVGYNNFSYFYKIFKNKYGASPNQYRNMI
ncbi:MAG TPA: helix-turn-helix domain-containing protein [Candidatus Pelethocola excrementipullorum]|nr:helix-turn-helix domain-containing protein [Candidatus Pelethocola excrementipullorum]